MQQLTWSYIDLASMYWAEIVLRVSGYFVAPGVVNMYFICPACLWELPFPSPWESDMVEINFTLRLSIGLASGSSVVRPVKKGGFVV